jgi:hypothetical protein
MEPKEYESKYPRFQLSAVYRAPKKSWKIKEVDGSWVSKRAPSKNGPLHGEIQYSKRVQYFPHLRLSPYPCLNIRIPYFHTYTGNVQCSVQYTVLLLYLMLVMSYCV